MSIKVHDPGQVGLLVISFIVVESRLYNMYSKTIFNGLFTELSSCLVWRSADRRAGRDGLVCLALPDYENPVKPIRLQHC